ncbi:Tetratricopeptide TPR-1 [Neofusicoccum parvum]|uniref:Tetratricopeptide TPR-1 n=1 Tax=Neofusicoccum parvum TaxID=310453 RepID=A0ACB5RXG0_9PEZI|nr:Tetratricopeptide TPR-1 [Neofusicoccum parvum]
MCTDYGHFHSCHVQFANSKTTLSIQEAKEIWQHTVLLFKHYDWSEAVVYTQRLLRRSRHTPGINRAAVWANLGILRMHLGEYYLALEAFTKAMKEAGISAAGAGSVGATHTDAACAPSPPPAAPSLAPLGPRPRQASHAARALSAADTRDGGSGSDPTRRPPRRRDASRETAAVYPFLAGLAAYHLARSGGGAPAAGLRAARRLFLACLALLPPGVEEVDMRSRGLAWTLERLRVVWNARICGVEAAWEEGTAGLVAGKRWGVNGMPGGLCFGFVGEEG